MCSFTLSQHFLEWLFYISWKHIRIVIWRLVYLIVLDYIVNIYTMYIHNIIVWKTFLQPVADLRGLRGLNPLEADTYIYILYYILVFIKWKIIHLKYMLFLPFPQEKMLKIYHCLQQRTFITFSTGYLHSVFFVIFGSNIINECICNII